MNEVIMNMRGTRGDELFLGILNKGKPFEKTFSMKINKINKHIVLTIVAYPAKNNY